MREHTCAIVLIGNEILSGKIQDSNAYFATRELRQIGVALKRIAVVPDELHPIAEEVARCAKQFDTVITSGGVGPTHDDITMEAVAIAFGRELVVHPELARVLGEHFADRRAPGMKMAEVPAGAVLNAAGDLRFPTVQLENVYILPGIPQIFEIKLKSLLGRFASDPYFIRTIYTSAGESVIAEHLNTCLAAYPDLLLGSYPKISHSEYRVKLTLESKDEAYLARAFNRLLDLLPSEVVVKVE